MPHTSSYPFHAVPPLPRRPARAPIVFMASRRRRSRLPLRRVGVEMVVPKVALDGISLSYKTTRAMAIAGARQYQPGSKAGRISVHRRPFGCGKSTLLHLIAGLHAQTSGNVLMDGKPVTGPGTDRILIFQELGLFPWLTVAGNVEFGMKMKNVPKAEREEKVRYYLRLVHLSKFQQQLYPSTLRRNAAAGGAGPRAGDGAGCAADGRAVRRTGRPNSRPAAR